MLRIGAFFPYPPEKAIFRRSAPGCSQSWAKLRLPCSLFHLYRICALASLLLAYSRETGSLPQPLLSLHLLTMLSAISDHSPIGSCGHSKKQVLDAQSLQAEVSSSPRSKKEYNPQEQRLPPLRSRGSALPLLLQISVL